MGDPRKHRKKSSGPAHPWNRARIGEEKVLVREFGLKNKAELWAAQSQLKRITAQAKNLIRDKKLPQAQKETNQLLKRLNKLSLITEGTPVEDVLALNVRDILERRLQSVVFKNKFAGTIKQARQLVVHGHVFVNGKKLDVPSYIVTVEDDITYSPKSSFNADSHAEVVKMRKKEGLDVVEVPLTEKELESKAKAEEEAKNLLEKDSAKKVEEKKAEVKEAKEEKK